MTAPTEEALQQDVDCDDQLGHWMCPYCNGLDPYQRPAYGMALLALCGICKPFEGYRPQAVPCAVCADLKRQPCGRCGQ